MSDQEFLDGLNIIRFPLHILLDNCELCGVEYEVWSYPWQHHRAWWCDECNSEFRSKIAKETYTHNQIDKDVV